MIHGYHVTFGTYGSWFPNDPRSSKSKFVGASKLFKAAGKARKQDPKSFAQLSATETQSLKQLRFELSRPNVILSPRQMEIVATAIDEFHHAAQLTIWALAILPSHVHIVLARSGGKCETIIDRMKIHIHQTFAKSSVLPLGCSEYKSIWASGRWIEFLDSEVAIENAIAYVLTNLTEAGLSQQHWPFVAPFSGIERNIVNYPD